MNSAVHRTPPELWTEIFKFSTAWLLLPIQGNNLSYLSYDMQDCDHIHRYISSLVIRARLRLVCRSWNAAIESMTDHLAISDRTGIYWPSKRHLYTSSFIHVEKDGLSCTCKLERLRKHSGGILVPSNLPPVSASETAGEYTTLSGPLITRVLYLQLYDAKISPYIILEEIPSLQVLTWTPYIEDDICSILRRFTGLTYLILSLNVIQAPQCSGQLDLPSMEYLHLAWRHNANRTEGSDSFSKWNMPKLTVLKMTGGVDRVTMNELDLFISKVRHSITSLQLDLTVDFNGGIGNTAIWNSFPNLSIIVVSLLWFFDPFFGFALMTVSNPLTVYIPNLHVGVVPRNALQTAVNLVKWCQEHPCTIKRIAIGRSWKYLARQIYNSNRPLAGEGMLIHSKKNTLIASMREFMGEVERSGIPICDCEEVLFEDEKATWFRDGLYNDNGFTADVFT